ncbi:MAG: aminoacyl-tRNA hydrolase [Anaerolineaceae bacterium]|jgi:ribosome-associated protein|nr:aminoacyl-tRNA hydrolase [Anaerolineaceae bacterium]
MIRITPEIYIDESEIHETFIRSSGPGGQNVNKVASAVQLRFDVTNSTSLPDEVKERLTRLSGSRITSEGVLIIKADQHRTQEQNRDAAIGRLIELIRKAAEKPKTRKKTRPTTAAKERRLKEKKQRGKTKLLRRPSQDDWD